jgi:signal transduction histidine kinase
MTAESPPRSVAGPSPVTEHRARTGLRGLALVGLVYVVIEATHPGSSGERLAALILTITTAVGWLCWLVSRYLDNELTAAAGLAVLAISGGGLVVLGPIGVAVVGVATLGAASYMELTLAFVIAGLGIAATAVGVAFTGHDAAVIGGATSGAAAGIAMGIVRRQAQARAEHTAQLALAEQRTEVEHARAEMLAERNRVAREVHDVLAHTLSALAVQMEALDSMLEDGATSVQEAVQRSRSLVVSGLDETRHAVHALRDEPVAAADQIAALAEQSGAGFELRGAPRSLPPGQGLALVRTAQEALTNARKHAAGARVSVRLDFEPTTVRLTVDNDGTGATSTYGHTGAGYGLRGMQERIELVGGSVTAGPHESGWRVQAVIAP